MQNVPEYKNWWNTPGEEIVLKGQNKISDSRPAASGIKEATKSVSIG